MNDQLNLGIECTFCGRDGSVVGQMVPVRVKLPYTSYLGFGLACRACVQAQETRQKLKDTEQRLIDTTERLEVADQELENAEREYQRVDQTNRELGSYLLKSIDMKDEVFKLLSKILAEMREQLEAEI